MKHIYLLIALLAITLAAQAQVYTVETVPNTKLVNNSYVSDPSRILNDSTVERINQLLGDLEKTATAQVAVVMLPSIGDEDHFDFAQQLFRYWGIGRAGTDNGLLILFIMDQRNIRFHTGYGLEGILPDVTCKRIQQRFMVPYFKEGNYNTGLLRGVEAVVSILNKPEAIEEILARDKSGDRYVYLFMGFVYVFVFIALFIGFGMRNKRPWEHHNVSITRKRFLLLYGVLPLLMLYLAFEQSWSFGFFFLVTFLLIIGLFLERFNRVSTQANLFMEKGDQQNAYTFFKAQKRYWLTAAVFFPIPMILVYQWYRKKRDGYRNHPRSCKKCKATTHKLSEAEEDKFLTPGEISEEKIGALDYDVWHCNACGSIELLRYANKKTKYTHCPQCNYLTYHLGAKRIIQKETYSADGNGESEHTCLHCGHHHIEKFIIAMRMSSSSDSDSGSSWSSSSDSGGSWGGGDSGGGGASSSW